MFARYGTFLAFFSGRGKKKRAQLKSTSWTLCFPLVVVTIGSFLSELLALTHRSLPPSIVVIIKCSLPPVRRTIADNSDNDDSEDINPSDDGIPPRGEN